MCWADIQDAKVKAYEAVYGEGSFPGPRPPSSSSHNWDIAGEARGKAGLTGKDTYFCPVCGNIRVIKRGEKNYCQKCGYSADQQKEK